MVDKFAQGHTAEPRSEQWVWELSLSVCIYPPLCLHREDGNQAFSSCLRQHKLHAHEWFAQSVGHWPASLESPRKRVIFLIVSFVIKFFFHFMLGIKDSTLKETTILGRMILLTFPRRKCIHSHCLWEGLCVLSWPDNIHRSLWTEETLKKMTSTTPPFLPMSGTGCVTWGDINSGETSTGFYQDFLAFAPSLSLTSGSLITHLAPAWKKWINILSER